MNRTTLRCRPTRCTMPRPVPTWPLAMLLITAAAPMVQAANVADSATYAWTENAGWLNLKATNGYAQIYSDHLEGYAWQENLGWLRLGTHIGGGTYTYPNNSASNYGVNRNSATGALSGYAWSENTGWVNFAPTNGGVNSDNTTGDLNGYAWAENAGWVRFAAYARLFCPECLPSRGGWRAVLIK